MIVARKTKQIICIDVGKGRRHDFRIYKESGVNIHPRIGTEVDSGYQGIQKLHANVRLPYKGTKKRPLNAAQKKHNHQNASLRIVVEHVIREVKIFRLLSERYRNRRKRFGLRINLIAGLYNYQLKN